MMIPVTGIHSLYVRPPDVAKEGTIIITTTHGDILRPLLYQVDLNDDEGTALSAPWPGYDAVDILGAFATMQRYTLFLNAKKAKPTAYSRRIDSKMKIDRGWTSIHSKSARRRKPGRWSIHQNCAISYVDLVFVGNGVLIRFYTAFANVTWKRSHTPSPSGCTLEYLGAIITHYLDFTEHCRCVPN